MVIFFWMCDVHEFSGKKNPKLPKSWPGSKPSRPPLCKGRIAGGLRCVVCLEKACPPLK